MLLALGLGAFGLYLSFGTWRGAQVLAAGEFLPNGELAYVIRLRTGIPGVAIDARTVSPDDLIALRLYEDGRLLGPANAVRQDIRERGGGRFLHRQGDLYLSASDNGDPRVNGRRYEIEFAYGADHAVIVAAAVMLFLGVYGFTFFGADRYGNWREIGGRIFAALRWRSHATLPADVLIVPAIAVSLAGAAGFFLLLFALPGAALNILPSRVDILGGLAAAILAFAIAVARLDQESSSGFRRNPLDNRRLGQVFSVLGIMLFALPLVEAWRNATSTYYHLSGLLPWTDASNYYFGGLHLLATGEYDYWNMRRPANAALMAARLFLAGGDLKLAIALNALIAGLATLVAAREMTRTCGLAAGVFFFAVVYLVGLPYLPTTMSEVNGLTLGAVALAACWRAAADRSLLAFTVGLTVLTLALNARAGPFFVLPAMLAWAAIFLAPDRRWIALGAGAAAIGVGFLLPQIFLWLWGDGSNVAHANFAQTLYGMAQGGKGWNQIRIDHPDLFGSGVSEGARAITTYRLALAAIAERPDVFIAHYFDQIRGIQGLLATRFPEEQAFTRVFVSKLGNGASAVGLLWMIVNIRQPAPTILLLSLAGISLSSPFLLQDGGDRVFIATAPIIAAVGAASFGVLRQLQIRAAHAPIAVSAGQPFWPNRVRLSLPLGAALVTIAILVVGPLLAVSGWNTAWKAGALEKSSCPDGQRSVGFTPGRTGAVLYLHRDEDLDATSLPHVRFADFIRRPDFAKIDIASALRRIRPPAIVAYAFDQEPSPAGAPKKAYDKSVWVIAEGQYPLLRDGHPIRLCGDPIPESESGWSGHVLFVRAMTAAR